MPTTNLDQWTFLEGHVQGQENVSNFLSAESVILCSGPPNNVDPSVHELIPVGLVQNVQVNQARQIQQIYEIGSREPFFVPGRTMVQAGMSRILFDGPSLLKAVYYRQGDSGVVVPDSPEALKSEPGVGYIDGTTDGTDVAGTGSSFYINLASNFFNKAIGLGFILKDQENDTYGGFYLEDCYIQTHTFSVAGQQTVLVENIGLRATRVVPISYSG